MRFAKKFYRDRFKNIAIGFIMNFNKKQKRNERFEIDPPDPDMDVKKIVKILKEIKGLKE